MSYRAQRLAAVVLLALFFPSVAMATAFALRPVRKPLVVYAIDRHQHVLAPGSRLAPGQHVTVVATGFLSRTNVQVVDVSRRTITSVTADRFGVARTPFVVPGLRATHLSVALDGAVAPVRVPHGEFTADAIRDRQTVTTTVPLLRRYPYRIIGGSGVDPGGVGLDPGTHTGDGTGGGLANTGLDVLALIAAGSLLVALGVVVARTGRRERS